MGDSIPKRRALPGSSKSQSKTIEQLKQRVAELEALFELAPVGLAIARDSECKRIDPNPAMRWMLRLPLEANASRTAPSEELPPFRVMRDGVEIPPHELPMQVAARTGVPVNGSQCHVVFQNGEYIHLLGSSTPLFDENNKPRGCIAAFLEITDYVRLARELRESRESAESATRAKDQFLANLSHELRSPISTMSLVLHLWEHGIDAGSPMFKKQLGILRRNTEFSLRLIDDLLDLQRIANGKVALVRRPLNLHVLLSNTVDSYRPAMLDKSLTLSFHPHANEHLILGDSVRLQQVIGNVLNNALKFTHTGGIDITTSNVEQSCRGATGRFVRVLITDTGIGFTSPAESLFQRFEQGGADTTQSFGGLGLGLAICCGFVEAHDGSICAHSEGPNRGTVITIDLPLT